MKTILITGAARGIGLATAKLMLSRGWQVAMLDRDVDELAIASEGLAGAVPFICDVSIAEQVEATIPAILQKFGQLDAVVNNAGVPAPVVGTRRQNADTWQRVMDVNLRGVFLVSQAASKILGRDGGIVNIASAAGICPQTASNDYGVSKAGVIMMTRTMACDLARYGIRVNAVAPGFIVAPMSQDMLDDMGAERIEVFRRRAPMGRFGTPEDIGNAVLFLLSDRSSFVTGAVLPVDGGWTAYGGAGPAAA